MAINYDYNVENDFPNSQVNLDSLTIEINDSSITVDLEYITVDSGICSIFFKNSLPVQQKNTLDEIVNAHQGLPPEDEVTILSGLNFCSASFEKETSTSSTSYVAKLSMETAEFEVGTYRVGWYYEWKRDTISDDFLAMIELDGEEAIMQQSEETKDANSWHVESGFYIADLEAGPHKIVLYYAGQRSRYSSYMRRARLEVWRVA